MHRHGRQTLPQLRPGRPAVEGDEQAELRPDEQQIAVAAVGADHLNMAARRQLVRQRNPAVAVVVGPVQVRVGVVVAVPVHGHEGRALGERRTFDAADGALGRRPRQAGGRVAPLRAAVARDEEAAVVRADPQDAGLQRRLGQGGDGVAAVVARPRLAARHVGADRVPLVAAVDRLEDDIASIVDRLRVVRRDQDRRVPVEAVGRRVGGRRLRRDIGFAAEADVDAAEERRTAPRNRRCRGRRGRAGSRSRRPRRS